jgi:hypothetical protein
VLCQRVQPRPTLAQSTPALLDRLRLGSDYDEVDVREAVDGIAAREAAPGVDGRAPPEIGGERSRQRLVGERPEESQRPAFRAEDELLDPLE